MTSSALPCRVGHLPQALQVFLEDRVIRVRRIGFAGGQHGARADEAGNVIDVAVGVVADNAALQPQNLFHSQHPAQRGFNLLARHSRIALLHRAEQALLGGQQQAASVHVNRSAFEHHLAARRTAHLHGSPQKLHAAAHLGNLFRKRVIELPVPVLGPGVELPVGDRNAARLVLARRWGRSRAAIRDWWASDESRCVPPAPAIHSHLSI